jgi:FtsP/CotA-like multicopper oxidase with cupredoxin domain
MKNLSLSLLLIPILLTGCASGSYTMMHNRGGMMGNNQVQTIDLLPGQNEDSSSLPEATPSSIIEVQDGQTISLNPTMVRKIINGKEIAMYGYNGEIPGPLLKVKQGSTFTVNVTNNIDLPTSIHWHGLRLDNASDGAVGLTQKEIAPHGSFTYTVKVPDEGIYWYHTHVREDLQQPMGLYGNILVIPADAEAYSPVNRDEVLAVTDLLLDRNGDAIPYGTSQADHTLMGRFGNTMLVNGQTDYKLDVFKGDVVRFYLTNTANTRTFRFNFGRAKMKLVGSDNGRYEQEQFVDSVTLSPSERAIVDVLFDKSGNYTFSHQTPDRSYTLGTVTVSSNSTTISYAGQFAQLASHADVSKDIDAFRSSFGKAPDHTLVLDMNMMGGRMMGGHGGMMGEIPKDGIEWEDTMGMMNATAMGNMMQWKMIDQATDAANKDLMYTAKVGDKVKIRIINKKESAHPMQHPIHFHGQRFLVLSDNGVQTKDFVWKDTVLVPAGHTVDILLDAHNPGDWMFHCHIAEHLSNGMMGLLKVQ